MAKKGSRVIFGLVCGVCKRQNYITSKNKINTVEALKMKKYCRLCKKRTDHNEKKKLH
ncbi:MAG TPA: 50S ribosomal protein L33 [Patescibacteria group bacterium]|nr:50S ribosomal protein L33 [Patescibacteria group bacterium]